MASKGSNPNVLLVVLDSVRAQNCSVYGHRNQTTPYLEELASEATLYTQARAPSNWSLPSHVSLFTGIETHAHKVTVHDQLQPGQTIFETLADRGYETGLFSENGFLTSHETGLKNAFETVTGVPEQYADQYNTTSLNPGPDGYYYADAFDSWRQNQTDPWAACVNLMDAHRPFEPREPYDQWGHDHCRSLQADLPVRWEWEFHGGERPYWQLQALEQLYDGGIRQVDAILEYLVTVLRETGDLDETLLVVCGDHGDGFGERGAVRSEPPAVSHIIPMSEALLHVPLLVRPPGGGKGKRCHHPAALTAFPDVVMNAVIGTTDRQGFARDQVFSTKQPVTDNLRERYENHCAEPEPYLQPSQAVYVDSPSDGIAVRKQYYWGKDAVEQRIHSPHERESIAAITPQRVEEAFDETEADVRIPLSGQQVTEGAKEQLAALGYY